MDAQAHTSHHSRTRRWCCSDTHVVADDGAVAPALCKYALAGVVGCVDVHVRHMPHELIRPRLVSVAQRRPWQPLNCTMLYSHMLQACVSGMCVLCVSGMCQRHVCAGISIGTVSARADRRWSF